MAGNRSVPYLRLDWANALPTLTDDMRGQIRWDPADGTAGDPDNIVAVIKRTDGTIAYVGLIGIAIQVGDAGTISEIQTMDFASNFFAVSESPTTEANVTVLYTQTHSLGSFFLNDIPGTATSNLFSEFFNTTTATSIGTSGSYYMPAAGRVLAAYLISDASRTAGTAQLRPTISGTGQNFTGGNPTLDGTNTQRHSVIVDWANGVTFNAGQRVGCELITSGWTPTTANVTATIVVGLTP